MLIKLYAKITPTNGEAYVQSFIQQRATPAKDFAHLNKVAVAKGLNCTYEQTTEAEYFAYREFVKADIARLTALKNK